MLKSIIVFFSVAILSQQVVTRLSPESIAAFILALMLGIFGWLGFESSRGKAINRKKILQTVGMALFAASIVEALSWYKSYHTELRAIFVTSASYFAEPLLMFLWDNRNRLFNKLFGDDKIGRKD